MATFITSKSVGESIGFGFTTTNGYYKYNHDGIDSEVKQGYVWNLLITNPNGEFTIIPCDVNGNPIGDLLSAYVGWECGVTSFDTTGLSSLTKLELGGNQITSLDISNTPNLIELELGGNQITSLDMSGLSSLTKLGLSNLNLTSLDNFTLPTSLTFLNLHGNQLSSIDLSDFSSLDRFYISDNQLTSLDEFILPTSLTFLGLYHNPLLTSFDLSFLTNLTELSFQSSQLTSFSSNDYILPSNLTILDLASNNLSSFDGSGFPTSITRLDLNTNLLTSVNISSLINLNNLELAYWGEGVSQMTPSANNQILQQLNQHGVSNGYFGSANGRTSASNVDYDNLLNNLTWSLSGLDLVIGPVVGNGRLAIRGIIR